MPNTPPLKRVGQGGSNGIRFTFISVGVAEKSVIEVVESSWRGGTELDFL